jgi:hypothetical protein
MIRRERGGSVEDLKLRREGEKERRREGEKERRREGEGARR